MLVRASACSSYGRILIGSRCASTCGQKVTCKPPPSGSEDATTCSAPPGDDQDPAKLAFWNAPSVWRRAAANTTRCLVGCSLGDLSMLYMLQLQAPDLPLPVTVAASCAAGIGTSLLLETCVLRVTERFDWSTALRTAAGMSMVSMVSMELAENAVELWLTGGMATC